MKSHLPLTALGVGCLLLAFTTTGCSDHPDSQSAAPDAATKAAQQQAGQQAAQQAAQQGAAMQAAKQAHPKGQ